MKISAAVKLASVYMAANIPVIFLSAPGLGKSDISRQLGAGRPFVDFRASLFESVDFKGIPSVSDTGHTVWNIPDMLPRADRDGENGTLFLDEITNAPLSVQGVLLQLLLDKRIGNYVFPASWRILAAGNRQADRASANRLSTAAANRCAVIELESDVDGWIDWAAVNGIHPLLIAFHKLRGQDLLHVMPRDNSASPAFPSPRSWALLSRALEACGNDVNMLGDLAAPLVGTDAVPELLGFVQAWTQLPKLPDVLQDPNGCPVPREITSRYAMACMLARVATAANFDSVVTYLDRLGAEFSVFAMLQATGRDAGLRETRAFVNWAVRNQAVQL